MMKSIGSLGGTHWRSHVRDSCECSSKLYMAFWDWLGTVKDQADGEWLPTSPILSVNIWTPAAGYHQWIWYHSSSPWQVPGGLEHAVTTKMATSGAKLMCLKHPMGGCAMAIHETQAERQGSGSLCWGPTSPQSRQPSAWSGMSNYTLHLVQHRCWGRSCCNYISRVL